MKECPQYYKTKQRTDKEYKALVNRLNRIEGQIRGIKGMLEKNAYCPDILIQVAAANAALNSFNKELLANHIKTCVAQDIRDGKNETIDELVTVLQKLMTGAVSLVAGAALVSAEVVLLAVQELKKLSIRLLV